MADRQWGRERLLQCPPKLFVQLRRFAITIRVLSIPPLLSLMPFITQLELCVVTDDVNGSSDIGDEDATAHWAATYAQISQLKRLQALSIHCLRQGQILPAYFLSLKSLTELGVLNLSGAFASDVCDNDVAELLSALPRLHTLKLGDTMPRLTGDALLALGPASRRLRSLSLPITCDAIATLGNAPYKPWFPCLESLEIRSTTEAVLSAELEGRQVRFIAICH
jgi:hypothetical protein